MQGIKDFIKADSLPQKDMLVFESLQQIIADHNQQLYQSILSSKKAVLKNFK